MALKLKKVVNYLASLFLFKIRFFSINIDEPEDSINKIQQDLLNKLFDDYVDTRITGDKVPMSDLLKALEDDTILDFVKDNYQGAVEKMNFGKGEADDDNSNKNTKQGEYKDAETIDL